MKDRYYALSKYFKDEYGVRVQKITIDAGFSCPNIDPAIGKDGCIYCNNLSFNPQLRDSSRKSIKNQIIDGIEFAKNNYKAQKFMAYFQAYTNTYASLDKLKTKYDVIKGFSEIIGLSVGTRPDCVDDEKLALLASYNRSYEVWVEYGLQSARDKTLELINRGHNFKVFEEAALKTKKKEIKVCAHVIIGLPGESLEDYIYTAKKIAKLDIEGVKLHPAHVVTGTKLAKLYDYGRYQAPSFKEYTQAASFMIEYLPPECVIQRLGASAPNDMLLAPEWMRKEKNPSLIINELLEERDSFQGSKFLNE